MPAAGGMLDGDAAGDRRCALDRHGGGGALRGGGGQRRAAGDLVENAVRANVRRVVVQLKSEDLSLIEPIDAGTLQIAGGYHDLETGVVEFML